MTVRTPVRTTLANSATASLAHNLHLLLGTIRCISQHEDALCELLHELQLDGPSSKVVGELSALLGDLPSRDYVDDLQAVSDMLEAASRPARRAPRAAAQAHRPGRKQSASRSGATAQIASERGSAKLGKSLKTGRKPSR